MQQVDARDRHQAAQQLVVDGRAPRLLPLLRLLSLLLPSSTLAAAHQRPALAAWAPSAAAARPGRSISALPCRCRFGRRWLRQLGLGRVLALHVPEVGGGTLVWVLLPHVHLRLQPLRQALQLDPPPDGHRAAAPHHARPLERLCTLRTLGAAAAAVLVLLGVRPRQQLALDLVARPRQAVEAARDVARARVAARAAGDEADGEAAAAARMLQRAALRGALRSVQAGPTGAARLARAAQSMGASLLQQKPTNATSDCSIHHVTRSVTRHQDRPPRMAPPSHLQQRGTVIVQPQLHQRLPQPAVPHKLGAGLTRVARAAGEGSREQWPHTLPAPSHVRLLLQAGLPQVPAFHAGPPVLPAVTLLLAVSTQHASAHLGKGREMSAVSQ